MSQFNTVQIYLYQNKIFEVFKHILYYIILYQDIMNNESVSKRTLSSKTWMLICLYGLYSIEGQVEDNNQMVFSTWPMKTGGP